MSQAGGNHIRAPGFACGVDEEVIRRLVHAFYGKVRMDPVLGPVFMAAVDDWDMHLNKLCDFWSSITLMSGRYKGQPVPAHVALPDIGPAHFVRWLDLFGETARELCSLETAELFVSRAGRIAESLQLSIAIHNGQMTVTPPVQPPVRQPEKE
jgi:hemoglobin